LYSSSLRVAEGDRKVRRGRSVHKDSRGHPGLKVRRVLPVLPDPRAIRVRAEKPARRDPRVFRVRKVPLGRSGRKGRKASRGRKGTRETQAQTEG
jgi:hypothetical protein